LLRGSLHDNRANRHLQTWAPPRLPTLASEQIEGVGMAEIELIQATYREIAERFGIGIEGARIKAKRRAAKGEWRLIPGNHPQDIVRVEMPAEEFRAGPHRAPRTPPNNQVEEGPTPAPQQDSQRKDTNDLEALVEVVSRLTAQSHSMTERLIEAERLRAEAQRDTAITQAEMKVLEERVAVLQEQHLAELKSVRERMATEAGQLNQLNQLIEQAELREQDLRVRLGEMEDSLALMRARPWWRRLVG